jgi:anti-sigma B factor antagonist
MPDKAEPPPAEMFHADSIADDIDTVITVNGELDASATESFAACVSAVLQNHPTSITVDARGLSFMDSSGLRSMLIARAAAEDADIPFRITQPSPALRHMVERTGLQNRLLGE